MKRILFFLMLFVSGATAFAQVSVTGSNLKMSDVIDYYKKYQQPYRNNQDDPDRKRTGIGDEKFPERLENKDYQFDRWKWYWQQHLDADGYLVSPVITFNAWKEYQEERSASRTTSVSDANWVFQGDDSSGADGSGIGRISVVAFHPTVATTFWIGSAGGGAWKTTNNGATWTNMTSQLPVPGINDIKYNPVNPNTMYLCTGDRDGAEYYSVGVLKTSNGGATWNTTGITYNENAFHQSNAILVNPRDTNSLVYASDQGIYRSFNGGATWTTATTGNFLQLLYHPTDTNVVYATSAYNYNTNAPSQIFRSANGGTTWTQITHFTDADRITLAVTPANIAIVKAIVSASDATAQDGLQGIYNSTDTGHTFTQIFTPMACASGHQNLLAFNANGSQCGGQGYYDLTLAIDPANANNVYCGGINGWRSTNGGASWQIMDQWANEQPGVVVIHADKHFMGFNPLVAGRFFETNDGGVYWSDNPVAGGVWNDVTNGLGITEFYRVAVSGLATYEVAGAQDVGSKYIQNFQYADADGGDGMECQIDPVNPTTFYTSIYYGTIDKISTTAGWVGTVSNNIPGTPTGGWVTPYIIEPTCHTCLVAGYQDVYRSTDAGNSWTDISGPLTTNDLIRVVTTPADSNTFYAAEDGSNRLYYTHNMGATSWTNLTAPYGGQIVSDVLIDPASAHKVWVTFSGYTTSGSPQISEYNDSAHVWTHYNTGMPNVPVNCIQIDRQSRTLYVGTEVGVFYRDTTMTQWQPFNTGMPIVSVTDLQINYTTNNIWAATFGRSLWSSAKHVPGADTSGVGVPNVPLVSESIAVHPNPNQGRFTVVVNNPEPGEPINLIIVNALGSTVWKGASNSKNAAIQVNTSGLVKGNYILQVSGAKGVIGTEKIVVD